MASNKYMFWDRISIGDHDMSGLLIPHIVVELFRNDIVMGS